MPSDSSMSSDLGMSKLLPVLIRAHSNLSHRTASYSNYSQFFANRLQFNLQSLLLVHADYGFATSECDLSHLSSRSAYNICPVPSLEVLTSDQSWQGCKFICDFLCKTLPLFKTKTNQKISNFDRLSALACKYIRRLGTTVRLCCCEKCVWTKACALGCLHSHSCRFVMLCYPQKVNTFVTRPNWWMFDSNQHSFNFDYILVLKGVGELEMFCAVGLKIL